MLKAKKTLLLLFMLLVGAALVACGGGTPKEQKIEFGETELSVNVGESIVLNPTLTNIESLGEVTFTTTKPDLITINGTTVTGVAAGPAVITATLISDSNISDSVIVRVGGGSASNVLTALEVSAVDTFLGIGGSAILSVNPTPAAASSAVTWASTDPSVATVTAAGLVSAVSVGVATIIATSSVKTSVKGSIDIFVNEIEEPGMITINGESSVDVNGMINLSVSFENNYFSGITWISANEGIATVSEEGEVTGVSQGTTNIQALVGPGNEFSQSITIVVNASSGLQTITITGNSTVLEGATTQLNKTLSGATGTIIWQSNNTAKATVSTTGLVTGIAAGTVVITASLASNSAVQATFNMTVQPGGTPQISISGATKVNVNELITLTANATVSATIIWSSDNTDVVIVNNGDVYGVAAGTAVVTAALSDNTSVNATVTITVVDPSAGGGDDDSYSISITGAKGITVGENLTLGYSITPTPTGAVVIEWISSNPLAASVDENGKVTGVSVGNATIYATIEGATGAGATASASINVAQVAVDPTITASASNSSITTGGYTQINATTDPSGEAVQYTSGNIAVATVDQTGKVTGVAAGTATITVALVSNSAISATVTITVTAPPVGGTIILTLRLEDMSSKPLDYVLVGGDAAQVTITNISETGSSTRYDFDWSSSNAAVATISSAGTITAVAAGSITITAELKSNPLSKGTVVVQVLATAPAALTVTATKMSFAVGETSQLGVAAGGPVTYSVPVGEEWKATVDPATGFVTAKAPSTIVVTATSTTNPLIKGTITLTITSAAGALKVKVYQSSAVGGADGVSLAEISKSASDGAPAGYYQVYVYDAAGATISRASCTFTVSPSGIVGVSIYGTVTTTALGSVTINVVFGGNQGSVTVKVVA